MMALNPTRCGFSNFCNRAPFSGAAQLPLHVLGDLVDPIENRKVGNFQFHQDAAFPGIQNTGVCQSSCPASSCGVSYFEGAGGALRVQPDISDWRPVARLS